MSFGMEIAQKFNNDGLNFVRTVKGAMVNTFTITATQGEILKVDIDYIAQSSTFTSGALTSITETTTRPFLWSDVSIQLPSGTAISNITESVVTINNNMEGKHYLNGSKEIAIARPFNRDYGLTLTVDGNSTWTKPFYEQYFLGGSIFNVLYEIIDPVFGAGSRDLFIAFSGCKVIDMDAPQSNEGINSQTITIQPQTASCIVKDTIFGYEPF
jgi:hypothetical protein